ncbi:hypothetical protein ACWCQ1_47445 [Streptomyces sp. NPDC002144]|uniref:hypothetical protein n=1 Tax=Streptomyces sp. NPDC006668 TaxID=3156903 RepID=UPI0033D248EB
MTIALQRRRAATGESLARFRLAITPAGHQEGTGPAGQDMPRPGEWPRPWRSVAQEGK